MGSFHHLGDGLYCEYNGYMIKLKANSETDPTDTVYLEPEVFESLTKFIKESDDENNK